jgi:hypothetical protein
VDDARAALLAALNDERAWLTATLGQLRDKLTAHRIASEAANAALSKYTSLDHLRMYSLYPKSAPGTQRVMCPAVDRGFWWNGAHYYHHDDETCIAYWTLRDEFSKALEGITRAERRIAYTESDLVLVATRIDAAERGELDPTTEHEEDDDAATATVQEPEDDSAPAAAGDTVQRRRAVSTRSRDTRRAVPAGTDLRAHRAAGAGAVGVRGRAVVSQPASELLRAFRQRGDVPLRGEPRSRPAP